MLRIRDCLDEGKFVGMLADRTFGEGQGQIVNFLGSPALFPAGPMRVAASLRRPVIFMTGAVPGRQPLSRRVPPDRGLLRARTPGA